MNGLFSLALLAASYCGDHQEILKELEKKYSEVVISSAIDFNGLIIETVVNKETGTWTLLVTRPRQPTCVITGGTGWREKKVLPGEEDA